VLRVESALPLKVAVDDGRRAGPEILDGKHRQRQGDAISLARESERPNAPKRSMRSASDSSIS
jgi:hypothetical protein